MSSINEKLLLNAAIERLIAGEDADLSAMRAIIAYSDKLDKKNGFSFEASFDGRSSSDSISGHTAEHGNVTVEDEAHEVHKECALGIKKDRIGHYKIWKARNGLIMLHHFWKSDRTTQVEKEDMPKVYHLGYNTKTLEPQHFGYEQERTIFICWFLFWFRLKWRNLKLLYGKERAKYYEVMLSMTTK